MEFGEKVRDVGVVFVFVVERKVKTPENAV